MSVSASAQVALAQNSQFILKVEAQLVNAAINIVNEVANQVDSLSSTATGGTFTLSYGGQTTPALNFNATAAQVQVALQNLTSIGAGNVVCTGGPLGTAPIVITFTGTLGATPLALPTIASSLTGGTATMTQTTAGLSVVNHTARAQQAQQIVLNPSTWAINYAWGVAGDATVQGQWWDGSSYPPAINQPSSLANDQANDTAIATRIASIFNAY